jgi:hypothetical protein
MRPRYSWRASGGAGLCSLHCRPVDRVGLKAYPTVNIAYVLYTVPISCASMDPWNSLIRGAERKIRASRLRVLICGSATRTMEAIQDHREPLYGRFDLRVLVHPFAPHEPALMLRYMSPSERAVVCELAGGVPLYLSWWDQQRSGEENLEDLACTPGQGMR